MIFDKYINIINKYLYIYLSVKETVVLITLNRFFRKHYTLPFIWKKLIARDFNNIPDIIPNIIPNIINNISYYIYYSIYYHPKYRCCLCYQPFLTTDIRYLLLCDCLMSEIYFYSHKCCLTHFNKIAKFTTLYYYKCPYCGKRKMTLPLKITSF